MVTSCSAFPCRSSSNASSTCSIARFGSARRPFGLGWLGPAAVLAILPAYSLIRSLGSGPWAFIAYLGAAVIGAIAAGYALRHRGARRFGRS